jgi:glycosyltransferase involved in cell wall biosynthesis
LQIGTLNLFSVSVVSQRTFRQSAIDPSLTSCRAVRHGLSVVIPCYNESAVLKETHRRVSATCRQCVPDDFQIIYVDDGSIDGTWGIISALSASEPCVLGVRLTRNYGHQLALSAGLDLSSGDRVLVIDADLQDPPELLAAMLRMMSDTGADVVYGQRRQRHGESLFKRLSAALFYRLLARTADVRIPIDTGDFRLMSGRVVEHLQQMPEQQRFIRGMISWLGFKQVPLVYDRKARVAGASHYPFHKMLRFAVDGITSFSIVPLRIAATLGIIFGLAGVGGLIYALGSWWAGAVVSGWTSVIAAVFVLGGAQLLELGMFGEYLGRLYLESKRRPLYVIDETVGASDSQQDD